MPSSICPFGSALKIRSKFGGTSARPGPSTVLRRVATRSFNVSNIAKPRGTPDACRLASFASSHILSTVEVPR